MIKGKNYDFINIPYFSDVVKDIEKTSNCTLVKDYEKWTPFTSVSVSDIAIAMITSLGDEMLALGKPVILYDYMKFGSEFFDFGSEVIAGGWSNESVRSGMPSPSESFKSVISTMSVK